MFIKKVKSGISFEGDHAKALLVIAEKLNDKDAEGADVIIGKVVEPKANQFVIFTPGEYEVKDIFIYAFDLNATKAISLLSINIDNINLVYMAASLNEVSKDELDQIGIDDVLIVDLDGVKVEDIEKKSKLVEAFDPELVIPYSSNPELIKKFANELGLVLPESSGKLKLNSSQFSQEESSLSLAVL